MLFSESDIMGTGVDAKTTADLDTLDYRVEWDISLGRPVYALILVTKDFAGGPATFNVKQSTDNSTFTDITGFTYTIPATAKAGNWYAVAAPKGSKGQYFKGRNTKGTGITAGEYTVGFSIFKPSATQSDLPKTQL